LHAVVDTEMSIPDTITVANGVYTTAGDVIYVVDGTGFAAADKAAFASGGLVSSALTSRGNGTALVTQGVAGATRWVKYLGAGLFDNGSSGTAAYYSVGGGFALGADHADGRGTHGGIVVNQTKTTNSASSSLATTGAFGGISRAVGNGEFALTAGYLQNQSDRQIANNVIVGGIETASANYGSVIFNPSITLPGALGAANGLFTVSYLGLYTMGYTETGATANLTVAGRMSHQLEAKVQLTSILADNMALRYGVDARYRTAADSSFTLVGSPFTIANANNGASGRAFFGVDMTAESGGARTLELGISSDGQTDAAFTFRTSF
jgi:hypothetical protein